MFTKLKLYLSKKSNFEKKLFKVLGFYPQNIELYKQALTHRSYQKKTGPHNERLEFLGDAVLGSVVGEILYNNFPDENEGFLTQMRSKIVNRKTLNKLAYEINLNKLVMHHRSASHKSIYGNALEALIGAVYIDKGQYKTVDFIKNTLLLPHLNLKNLTQEVASYKSKVLEWGQQNKKEINFKILETTGKDHKKFYKVALLLENEEIAQGAGSSVKRAEEQASQKAQTQLPLI